MQRRETPARSTSSEIMALGLTLLRQLHERNFQDSRIWLDSWLYFFIRSISDIFFSDT